MAPDKEYNPQEPVTITLTMEQWDTVRHWLQYGTDYHRAKVKEWLAVCNDKQMGGRIAAQHEKAAAEAEAVYKIVDAALYPQPPAETE